MRMNRRWRATAGAVLTAASVAACDFSVENPGPVQDEILDQAAAHQAVVNGIARYISLSLNNIALQTGAVVLETRASGNTTISLEHGLGQITPSSANGLWRSVQEARWIGDDGVRRLTEAKATNELIAQANLWAGFANRWGDILCETVIDGGPKQASTVMLEKAVAQFTQAYTLSTVTATKNAALAGRASVYADLNRWTEAVADARQIADNFVFQARYSAEEAAQRNEIFFYTANAPYRVHSAWRTPYEDYYTQTSDPRTPWIKVPQFPYGEIQRPKIGNVPWYPQQKYKAYTDPINLVSGREMRLLEAEALLIANNVPGAMALINRVRTTQRPGMSAPPATVQAYTATTLDAAWAALKAERGIELWLEGRRMADLRRWKALNRPGALRPLEDATNPATYLDNPQSLCIPVSQNEIDTNPNF
jgi:starch-binding outer membrane protein, SusD/RagB family